MSRTKTKQTALRHWLRLVRIAILLLLCLGLIGGGLFLPQLLGRWVDRQFNHTLQLGEPAAEVQPLTFLERLSLFTDSNAYHYSMDIESGRTAETAFQDGINGIMQLSQTVSLPYYDTDLMDWAQGVSGFDDAQGKPAPTCQLLLNRQTGQGSAFWYLSIYPNPRVSYGCNITVDDETGKVMQYYYYNQNLDCSISPYFVSDLAVFLSEYWELEVLDVLEILDSTDGSQRPGVIVFGDDTGNRVSVVVDAGSNYLSINQYSTEALGAAYPTAEQYF